MKKTLLIAAAALAGSIISSEAQVYSQNVVGYVNVVFKSGGNFSLVANPLDDGTNTADSILAALPNKSTIQLWDQGLQDFVSSTKTAGGFAPAVSIPVGTGFFVQVTGGSDFTNTFVGTVVPANGQNSTNNIPGGVFKLVASALPVGGTLNDLGTNALNLAAALPNKSTVQFWDESIQDFTSSTKTAGGFSPNLPVKVGEGFFINGNGSSAWVQTLQQ